jgi:large repetitive protein
VNVASGLAINGTRSAATVVTVPATLAAGTYYLGAIADYTNAQAELSETNNSFTGVTIQVTP